MFVLEERCEKSQLSAVYRETGRERESEREREREGKRERLLGTILGRFCSLRETREIMIVRGVKYHIGLARVVQQAHRIDYCSKVRKLRKQVSKTSRGYTFSQQPPLPPLTTFLPPPQTPFHPSPPSPPFSQTPLNPKPWLRV